MLSAPPGTRCNQVPGCNCNLGELAGGGVSRGDFYMGPPPRREPRINLAGYKNKVYVYNGIRHVRARAINMRPPQGPRGA